MAPLPFGRSAMAVHVAMLAVITVAVTMPLVVLVMAAVHALGLHMDSGRVGMAAVMLAAAGGRGGTGGEHQGSEGDHD